MMCYTYYYYCYYYRKPISYNNNKIPCCETRCQNTVYVEHCAKVCLSECVCVGNVRWSVRVSISSKVNGSISYNIILLLCTSVCVHVCVWRRRRWRFVTHQRGGNDPNFQKHNTPDTRTTGRVLDTHVRSSHSWPTRCYVLHVCECICGVTIAFFHTPAATTHPLTSVHIMYERA